MVGNNSLAAALGIFLSPTVNPSELQSVTKTVVYVHTSTVGCNDAVHTDRPSSE